MIICEGCGYLTNRGSKMKPFKADECECEIEGVEEE